MSSFNDSESRGESRGESMFLPQAKMIIIGDSTVGKSSIIWKYISDDFKLNMPSTIGLDCNTKSIKLNEVNELKLQIWDTAGQEKYRCLISNYFKDAHGALIVFDLTVKETFEALKTVWLENLKKNAPSKICKVVLANKCDKIGEIEVSDEEIDQFEKEFNLKCFKTSAKDNIGIKESFEYLAYRMNDTFLFITIKVENPFESEKPRQIKIRRDGSRIRADNSDLSDGSGCC